MQKRLIANGGSQKYFVGETVTLADFNNAHIAYTYFLNESNKLLKEHSEVLHQDQYKELLKYYKGLHDEVFKEYFESRPTGKPF